MIGLKKRLFCMVFIALLTFVQYVLSDMGIYPYISGDTFRAISDFALHLHVSYKFKPSYVKNGDIVFVRTDLLPKFFSRYYRSINAKFILITHSNDKSAPERFEHYLNEDKIIAWFAKNATVIHPKLMGIPIGLPDQKTFDKWIPGTVQDFDDVITMVQNDKFEKKYLLYMNFGISNLRPGRDKVWNFFKDKSFCYWPKEGSKLKYLTLKEYLIDQAQSKFVLSPSGSGIDCYRTWEALLVGSYPVVKTSPLDYLYQDLPVLIVKEWDEVTEELLEQTYKEFSKETFNREKIYASYWIDLIQSVQQEAKKNPK